MTALSSSVRRVLSALAAGAAVGLAGCVEPSEPLRLNAPPQGEGLAHPRWGEYYAYHDDQGMMADRSIADIHFVPGSADLSGTGIARLDRYAELLATTGGTLRYDPTIRDEALINDRLAAAKAYLDQMLPGAKGIKVVSGMADGRGMSATEAIEGKKVAQQAEPRATAYKLSGGASSSGD